MMFPDDDLARVDAAAEIEIETRSPSGEIHRTIVWPVVRDRVVYVRSFLGTRGRWYREAIADPAVALHVDGRRLAGRAVLATDAASVAACSDGFRAKYRPSASLDAMLLDEVLPTTLRIEAAPAEVPA